MISVFFQYSVQYSGAVNSTTQSLLLQTIFWHARNCLKLPVVDNIVCIGSFDKKTLISYFCLATDSFQLMISNFSQYSVQYSVVVAFSQYSGAVISTTQSLLLQTILCYTRICLILPVVDNIVCIRSFDKKNHISYFCQRWRGEILAHEMWKLIYFRNLKRNLRWGRNAG